MKYHSNSIFGSIELDTDTSMWKTTTTIPDSRDLEISTLERAVCEAAIAWRDAEERDEKLTRAECFEHEGPLWDAVDALKAARDKAFSKIS